MMTSFLTRLTMHPLTLFAVFADATAALAWDPTKARKAQDVSGKFNVGKAKQATLAVGPAKGIALPVKAIMVPSVDVWRHATGVGLLDFSPVGKLPGTTDKAVLKTLAAHFDTLARSAAPRVAGTLEITSGMLAIFDCGQPYPIAAAKLAAGKPVTTKGAVAVPLENGSYTVTVEALGPDRSKYHTDKHGMYRRRIRIERS